VAFFLGLAGGAFLRCLAAVGGLCRSSNRTTMPASGRLVILLGQAARRPCTAGLLADDQQRPVYYYTRRCVWCRRGSQRSGTVEGAASCCLAEGGVVSGEISYNVHWTQPVWPIPSCTHRLYS
jgi:hypothetical protein